MLTFFNLQCIIIIIYLKVPNVTEKVLTNVFQLLCLRGSVFVQDSDSVEIIKVEPSLVESLGCHH